MDKKVVGIIGGVLGAVGGMVAYLLGRKQSQGGPGTPDDFPCPYCDLVFDTEAELLYHIDQVHPQASLSELHGTILDDNGVPLVGASVIISGPSYRSLPSNEYGDFSVYDIEPGEYTIHVSKINYTTQSITLSVSLGRNDIPTAIVLTYVPPGQMAGLQVNWIELNPTGLYVGETLVVQAQIENVSGHAGDFAVFCMLGEQPFIQDVHFEYPGWKNVYFNIQPSTPGTFPVSVGDKSQEVTVMASSSGAAMFKCPLCGQTSDEEVGNFTTYDDLLYHSMYNCSKSFYCGGGTSVGDKYYFRACCPYCSYKKSDLYRIRGKTTVKEVAAKAILPHIRDHHYSEIFIGA
jgi:hypothetical protein